MLPVPSPEALLMKINNLAVIGSVLAALSGGAAVLPAQAQQNGTQPVETSTPWNPEALPVQAVFDYGSKTEPTLTCSPKNYCAISLEAGETLQSVDANDDHWSVTPTTYGAGTFAKPVILITPRAAGFTDEMTIVSTSAKQQSRNYKIKLISDAKEYTHLTGFRYPMGQ
jgi:hypothetical protein